MKESGKKPSFQLSYTATTEYSLRDISPTSWGALVER